MASSKTLLKTYPLLAGMAALLGATQVSAVVLVRETFSYTDGSLVGKGGGAVNGFSQNWWGGTNGTGVWTVENQAAKISGNHTTWAGRNLSPVSQSDFYFTLDLGVDTLDISGTTNFRDTVVFAVGGTTFNVGVVFTQWGYGIRAQKDGDHNLSSSQAINTAGTTYTVVGHYAFDDGADLATLTLWLNPEDETDSPDQTLSWEATDASVSRVTLQRFDNSQISGTNSTVFDNILIGTSWADLSQVPEPASWGTLAGGLALGLAVVRSRGRRRL